MVLWTQKLTSLLMRTIALWTVWNETERQMGGGGGGRERGGGEMIKAIAESECNTRSGGVGV